MGVALEQRHLGLSTVDGGRQERGHGAERVERGVVVNVLECHLERVLHVGRWREPRASVVAKLVLRRLVLDNRFSRACGIKAVGHTLVGGYDAQSEARGCEQVELVGLKAELALAVERRVDGIWP